MPLFYSLIHHIPKECFSPLKQSTTAWASLREEDQEQDQQQIKSQVKNLQSKSAMSYINRSDLFQKLFVSKARCPCFIHQNSTGNGAHYTHEHFPPGNVWVCCQSPKYRFGDISPNLYARSKAGWTVVRVPHPPHSTPRFTCM